MTGEDPGFLQAGMELTLRWLNKLLAMARANRIRLGDNSGLAMIRGPAGTYLRAISQPSTEVVEAIVTTAIGACSGTTYGTGQAQPYINNGSGVGIPDPAYPSPVDVLNWLQNTNTVAVNKHVYIANRGNYWILIAGDC